MKNKTFNINKLNKIVQQKLIDYNLVPVYTKISLTPIYSFVLKNTIYYHYVINCSDSQIKFFLKSSRGVNNASHCNDFLKMFRNHNGEYTYPIILIPEFKYNGISYFITTFTQGDNLDILSQILTKYEWGKISNELRRQLEELSTIHANLYSEKNQFLSIGCAEILKNKLKNRLKHSVFLQFPNKNLKKAYERCCEILDCSQFSVPTLLHMDIKPANIIYNPKTGLVKLVDFEFARFGDFDFGLTQILLTKCNTFSKEYNEYIYPNIIEGNITLNEALNIPKFRCYIFYQTACNLIYYKERNVECPIEMKKNFVYLLDQFSKE